MNKRYKFFINGDWVQGGDYYELRSPHTNEVIGEIPKANQEIVKKAIDSANKTNKTMKNLSAFERAEILNNVVKIFKEKKNQCIDILIRENAKPFKAATQEIERTIETYQFAADEAKKIAGEIVPIDAAKNGKNRLGYTKLEPLGVIAAITPFNFPFNLVAHKLGPAIATGNTVVLKPASQTPLSAIMTAEIFEKAGLPKGAINLIFGSGKDIGKWLTKDEVIKMITFTGSVEVGEKIKGESGLKKIALELGSNAAVIVEDTENINAVAKRCVEGSYGYSGQTCISVQRIYVKKALEKEFIKSFKEETSKLNIGDPNNKETDISSLITEQDAKRVENWIGKVNKENIIIGGERNKSVINPTILKNVSNEFEVSCKEVFGPVVIINTYETLNEAIDLVNDSNYGLQAGVYTQKIDKAFKCFDEIEVGGVMINDIPSYRVDQMPYGGVKKSGIGKEGIKYAVEEMVEKKLCLLNLNK
ncbi:aldehyde dehydrogenase family protein [Mammaliicoccus lentus]|uniref:aldehyde dehydrogenase family protein n=1 Tax=Mammaliicoccus lentus TaxID=42858 RepID=UPI001C4F193E|nr:aldehyde dehydrogenase family protein [Mammaliicoccus lentus]MBW0767304.1 aldehyde dehydrogenase family protein [Mammaliicoccus lentus]